MTCRYRTPRRSRLKLKNAPSTVQKAAYGKTTSCATSSSRRIAESPRTYMTGIHLMFTLSGDGVVEVEEEPGKRTPYLMKTGYWTRVPGGLVHGYKNDADIPLEFFCIVPTCGDPHAKKYAMRAERAARKEAEKAED